MGIKGLRIETGRFTLPPLPIDDRKCFICEDMHMVEDELHFLFDCDYYHELDESGLEIAFGHRTKTGQFTLNPNNESFVRTI